MARKRVVSPELLTSESVASLPFAARYGFVGLWMYLDDEGRGKDNPALIRAHLWPLDESYTARKVAADLQRWAEQRLICRYVVDDVSLLHAPRWSFWQKINHPTASRIPPCPVELNGDDHESLPWDYRSPTGVLTEAYRSPNRDLPRNVVQENSIEGSSSGPDHERDDCLRPALCVFHKAATA